MRTTAVVIGAGHCGLAMSSCLSDRSIDHVVLERREVANSWRTERWDSLRLLTPNWQCRLPGYTYGDDDPDGFSVITDQGQFDCRTVVLASGAFNIPKVPAFASEVPASVTTLTPMDYR